ncbi:hypothetical protein [Desulfurivibrio alkaliphilus]|uniref:hypothetical protein n=1 Tax=Desulfurivibrio alkaliphilus TaxID=427923 RepID=UPI0002FCDD08|nr:hypothetical protein [Desulfurivibrio alkaliphilus]
MITGRWIFKAGAGAALLLTLALQQVACSSALPHSQAYRPLPLAEAPRSLAVLPVIDHGDHPPGGRLLMLLLADELAACRQWRVALEGDVMNVYRQLRLPPWQVPDQHQLQAIAGRLGAELLIAGEVLAMEERPAADLTRTMLEVRVRVFDRHGRQLWSTSHQRRGEDYRTLLHFGVPHTISGLARNAAGEILTHWQGKEWLLCPDS